MEGQQTRRKSSSGRRGSRGEQPMVSSAKFTSYYGLPVINSPVWRSPDIPGYLFLGGLAGASSVLAAGAQLTDRRDLASTAKTAACASVMLGLGLIVHDLGRPGRFLNMLRTLKVTSPMSVGSWLLGAYVPTATVSCASALTGRLPRLGAAATAGAAVLGPAIASYTAALVADTAVPAWHDGYRELPFVFVGSAATAAGGMSLLAATDDQTGPARNLVVLGAIVEAIAASLLERRMGMVAEPYHSGKSGAYMRAGKVLSGLGIAGALLSGRSGLARRLAGATLLGASAATRWGVFHAGLASADDPKYTVLPQRERLRTRQQTTGP